MEHDTEESGLRQPADGRMPEQVSESAALDELACSSEVDEPDEADDVSGADESAEIVKALEANEAAGVDEAAAAQPDEIVQPDQMAEPADAHEPDDAGQGSGRLAEHEHHQATGEPRVDQALQMLDELAELPVSEHPAVFEQVHARLRDVLGELDLDSGPRPSAGAQQGQGG